MFRAWIVCAIAALWAGNAYAGDAPRIAVSIKPLHSLVSGVMAGVGQPDLIVKGGGSPHAYAFKPSEAMALSKAEAVFWVGETLERFLVRPLASLAPEAVLVELMDTPGLRLLRLREGGAWDGNDHDSHDSHDSHGGVSTHIWLDPVNARAMVAFIAVHLMAIDRQNAAAYQANAARLSNRLDALSAEMAIELAPLQNRPFIVFHDAYQHLEARYGLQAVGAVTLSPSAQPGAGRIAALRARIKDSGALCIFSEPQFTPKLTDVLIEGLPVKKGVLDPLGSDLESGPELYFELMRRNLQALKDCLSERDTL